jgi:hypothetical protein
MANVIRIKRRVSGAAGAPSGLKTAELAYNMADDTLYAGYGDDGSGNATSVKPLGGEGTFAKLASPALTGTPTAPTATGGTNTTQIATTAFVQNAVSGLNSGTVTSVALTVPTGLSVSGSPITSSGTFAVTYASGYSIPTNTSQTNWDTAYGWGNHASAGYFSASGGTISGAVTITGNLTVDGTTTTVNSTTITVDDKNIELGSVASPSDTTADGGGITLKGTTDKTFNWVDATDAWTSSEHVNLASGKSYYINGTQVLSSSTLGSGVTSSSLTSVGTIATGVWNGTAVALAYGGTGADLSGSSLGTIFKKGSTGFVAATAGTDYLNDASTVDGGTF